MLISVEFKLKLVSAPFGAIDYYGESTVNTVFLKKVFK